MKVTLLIAVMLASTIMVESYGVNWGRRRRKLNKKAEGQANLDMLKEFLEMDGSNGDLNGATFEKKVAALEEADAELEEDVKEMEEDAALGLVEEELEELEEELEEVEE
ncbi:uncharacterized protein LOC144875364 [Branchiostoma floridae x Branchiostoma japonicum]